MNEVIRVLKRSLRPFGYDIRKRKAHNLLPFKGLGSLPCLDRVRHNFDYDGGPERKATSDLNILKIVFRTCLTEQRSVKSNERIAGATLVDIVERCFLSLIKSVNAALIHETAPHIEVIILDDHSDTSYVQQFQRMAQNLKCPWSLKTTKQSGQGASLHEQFAMALHDDALYYFCEDDYLHALPAIYEMWVFYRQVFQSTQRHLVLHPQEHPCLYRDSQYPSYFLLSQSCHWRSVSDATHILFTHSHVVRDYWKYFVNTKFVGEGRKRRLGSERMTTNKLFQHIPGFVPLPALAGHFQSLDDLPPFFDWKSLWDANDPLTL